jgi:hypothetical protein
MRGARIHVLTKSGKWVLSIQSSSPTATRGGMKNVYLSTSSASGSKQRFFVLPHSHSYTLPSSRHVILDSNPDPKIDVLLALSDCISHVRCPTKINISLTVSLHHTV